MEIQTVVILVGLIGFILWILSIVKSPSKEINKEVHSDFLDRANDNLNKYSSKNEIFNDTNYSGDTIGYYLGLYKKLEKVRKKSKNGQLDAEEYIAIWTKSKEVTYKTFNDQNTPHILKRYREFYAGETLESLNDLYFDFLDKIQQANREKNIQELLFHCQSSLGLIEPLICYNYKEYGDFKINIPAIIDGLNFNSVLGIRGQVKNYADIVNYFDVLKSHKRFVDEAFERLTLCPKIYDLVKTNGSVQRSKIKKMLGYQDGSLVRYSINDMIMAGKLVKHKEGRYIFVSIA